MRHEISLQCCLLLPTSSIMSLFLSVDVKVSDRVERRLQEIEREMRTERELVERRQDQLGLISLQLQEVCKKKIPSQRVNLKFDNYLAAVKMIRVPWLLHVAVYFIPYEKYSI